MSDVSSSDGANVRLTRIAIDGDAVVDLHPRLTLVRGLSAEARQRLADAIGGLPEGTTRGLSGWVELDGARRELGAEVFEGRSVPADVDLVVRPGDLPGSDPALHRVSSRRADLGYERDRLLERLESARERVREATEECGRTLRDWQVVHGGLPDVGDDGQVVAPDGEEAAGEPEEDTPDPRAELVARLEEIDRALLPLTPVEPSEVQAALDAAINPTVPDDPEPVELEPDEAEPPDAVDEPEPEPDPEPEPEPVEDRWAHIGSFPPDPFADTGEDLFRSDPFAEPGSHAADTVPFEDLPDPVIVAGRLRVAEARRAVAAARATERSTQARAELIEELEQAHTDVVEAHHRDRFGRSRNKVEEARTKEQRLLDQLGFPSYTAFVLSAGAIRGGDQPDELDAAEAGLAEAEAELARIVAARASGAVPAPDSDGDADADADGDDNALEAEAGEQPAAVDGLHAGDGYEVAEAEPAATAELRLALAEVGLVFDDVVTDPSTLMDLARSWLDEQESALARREELLAERGELEDQLALLPDPSAPHEPLSEVAALAQAEAELLGAEAEVSGITTRLEEIAEETKDLVAEEAESDEEVVIVPALTVEQRVDDVTWYLATRLAAIRGVGEGVTLPIVLDDPFVDFEGDDAISLVGSVEPFGGAVQLVVLTDDPALVAWTEGLGTERAWVVTAGQ